MDERYTGFSGERRSLRQETAHHYYIPSTYQAYKVLHFGYTVLPIIAGLDKFFHVLVNWNLYLTPLVPSILGITAGTFMRMVGVIEIIAGLITAYNPKVGGYLVALWLCGVVINLLSIPAYFDIALRDLGLSLGAFALARLSYEFRTYRRVRV